MRKSLLLPGLLILVALIPLRAEETLWNLTFKDVKPGQAPTEVAFVPPCSGPQKVATDTANTLLGAATLGTLKTPLVFTKGSKTNYLPSFTLKADTAYTSGVITVNLDVLIDHVTPGPKPIETLMAFPFLNAKGGSDFILIIASSGGDKFVLASEGLARSKQPPVFTPGTVAHIKAVLDLDKHTFQAFLDNVPLGDAEHDDTKFSSFLGFTVRDGTALGGNGGATFTAGIANLVITHS